MNNGVNGGKRNSKAPIDRGSAAAEPITSEMHLHDGAARAASSGDVGAAGAAWRRDGPPLKRLQPR